MKGDYWLNSWEIDKTGWRQRRPNTRLVAHWSSLGVAPEVAQGAPTKRVFVPLCGDSPDLLWLAEAGYEVIGSELSDIAAKRFFDDASIAFTIRDNHGFACFESDQITIICGDFFELSERQVGHVDAVYDRAATVAMPEDMRPAYAARLASLCPAGARMMLISMAYDQDKMKGPPFSVPEHDVRALYGSDYAIEVVNTSEGPDILGNLRERGLNTLKETVYCLTRLPD